MARTAMDPVVQRNFNLAKGSVPPRRDIAADDFDVCARHAMAMVRGQGDILPAIGSSMGIGGAQAGAISDAIARFFARDLTPEAGAQGLRAALEATR
jgi:glucose/mannose transport system substrate-binding protein